MTGFYNLVCLWLWGGGGGGGLADVGDTMRDTRFPDHEFLLLTGTTPSMTRKTYPSPIDQEESRLGLHLSQYDVHDPLLDMHSSQCGQKVISNQ